LGVLKWTKYWNPVLALGYCRLLINFIKYSPPAYWNYKRKSTKGWSIFGVILDLTGSTFSFASALMATKNGINITKMFSAPLNIFFNIIYMSQHYILYKTKSDEKLLENKQK
jgi:cystinosin